MEVSEEEGLAETLSLSVGDAYRRRFVMKPKSLGVPGCVLRQAQHEGFS